MRALITSSAIAKEGGMGLGQPIAWYSLASALAVAFGVAAAFGGKLLMIFAFGAMGGLVLLFAPVQLVLRLFLFLCFLVVGPLTSIADIQQALWAPYMIALVLLVRTPMEWNHTSTLKYRRPGIAGEEVSPVMWAVVCYFALMLVSFAVNFPEPMQGLVAAKLYVFVWGVFFLLVVSSVSPQTLERMWKGFLLIAFLQFPFALYQRFVEVPRRTHFDTAARVVWMLSLAPSRVPRPVAQAGRLLCSWCFRWHWRYLCGATRCSAAPPLSSWSSRRLHPLLSVRSR